MEKEVRKQKKTFIIAGGMMRLFLYAMAAIFVLFLAKAAYDFGYGIFYQEPMASKENGRDVTVAIEEGDSVYQIGKTLKKKGLIEDAKVFVIQEMLSNSKGKLKPGTYILNTSMTTDEMLEILSGENTAGQPEVNGDGSAKEGDSEIQDGSGTAPQESGEAEQ